MNKEKIKEILGKWKCYIGFTKKFTTNEYEMLRVEDIDKILDYITNLQEEINKLTSESTEWESKCYDLQEKFNALLEAHKIADELETEYQDRINKAIDYIRSEYTITDDDVYLALYSSDGTLDKLEKILKGEK